MRLVFTRGDKKKKWAFASGARLCLESPFLDLIYSSLHVCASQTSVGAPISALFWVCTGLGLYSYSFTPIDIATMLRCLSGPGLERLFCADVQCPVEREEPVACTHFLFIFLLIESLFAAIHVGT